MSDISIIGGGHASGKLVNNDSSHLGSRQNLVIDITKLLEKIK